MLAEGDAGCSVAAADEAVDVCGEVAEGRGGDVGSVDAYYALRARGRGEGGGGGWC